MSRAQLQDGQFKPMASGGKDDHTAASANSPLEAATGGAAAAGAASEGTFFDKFVGKGVTWVDLETRFGGDPEELPLLRKLTNQVCPHTHAHTRSR